MESLDQLRDADPTRARFRRVKLTPEQDREEQKAMAFLMITQPFFSHLLLSQLELYPTDFPGFPIAATDEFKIYIRPDTFYSDRFDTKHRAFMIAHEILHCVWKHCSTSSIWRRTGRVPVGLGKELPYDNDLMNIAMDLVINAVLKHGHVGEMPDGVLYDPMYSAQGDEEINAVYEKVYKIAKGGGQGKGKGKGNGPEGDRFDELLEPGEGCGKDESDRNDAEWQIAVTQAAAVAKMQGLLPAGLEQLVGEITAPKVSWQDRIRSTLNRRLGEGGYDWRMPNRRLITREDAIYFATQSSFQTGLIVVGSDSSGSCCDPAVQGRFFSEMAGIISDCAPEKVIVMFCDAYVHRVDELEDVGDLEAIRQKGAPGGGGTSFVPVFEKIKEMNLDPSALIYFTDMYGTFPDKAPPYPVIWAKITDAAGPGWGDEVKVEE